MTNQTDWPAHVEAAMQLIRICSETIPRDVQDRMREVLMASGEQVASEYKMIGREPTDKMIDAGILAYEGKCEQSFRAMWDAAPQVDAASVAITQYYTNRNRGGWVGKQAPAGEVPTKLPGFAVPVADVLEMAAHYVETGSKSTILAAQIRRIAAAPTKEKK